MEFCGIFPPTRWCLAGPEDIYGNVKLRSGGGCGGSRILILQKGNSGIFVKYLWNICGIFPPTRSEDIDSPKR